MCAATAASASAAHPAAPVRRGAPSLPLEVSAGLATALVMVVRVWLGLAIEVRSHAALWRAGLACCPETSLRTAGTSSTCDVPRAFSRPGHLHPCILVAGSQHSCLRAYCSQGRRARSSTVQNGRALCVHAWVGALAALCPAAYFLAPRPAWRRARTTLVAISRMGIAAALTLPVDIPVAPRGPSWLGFLSAFLVYSAALPMCFLAAMWQVPLRWVQRLLHAGGTWRSYVAGCCAAPRGAPRLCLHAAPLPLRVVHIPPPSHACLDAAQAAPASGGAAAGHGLAQGAEPLRRTHGRPASSARFLPGRFFGLPLPSNCGVA